MSAVWTSSVPSTAAAKEAQSAVRNKKWDNMPDGFHEVMLWKTLTIYDTFAITTACRHRMAHRKWKETKLQPGNMLGCCFVSFHFLWVIPCPQAVQGDPSTRVLYSVDIKTKVPSQYRLLLLKRNNKFNVNKICRTQADGSPCHFSHSVDLGILMPRLVKYCALPSCSGQENANLHPDSHKPSITDPVC